MEPISPLPLCLANTGKESYGVDTSLPMFAFTYWNIQAQYFALINLSLKFKFCDKASFSLLLILLALDLTPVLPVHHPDPGPAEGEAACPLEAGHRSLEAEAVTVIRAVEAGDEDGGVDDRSGDDVRVLIFTGGCL